MKKRLAALLVAVGAIGGLVVFVPRPDVTKEELMDAGLAECRVLGIECPVHQTLVDGGGLWTRRANMLLEGHLCDVDDGGQALVALQYWDWEVSSWGACKLSGADGGWPRVLP